MLNAIFLKRALSSSLLVMALSVGAIWSGGCSGGPSVSGTAIFNTRVVTVGEPVEIRLPFDRVVGLEWTLDSYDSLYLGYQGRTYAMDDQNKGTMIISFIAKTPGETELTLRRRYSTAGKQDTFHDYTINILQK
jgi:predicted secreted protein